MRKLGWKADIYVPKNFPETLLYSNKDILMASSVSSLWAKLDHLINGILTEAKAYET